MTVDRAYLAAEAAKNSHWYEKPMRYGNLTWVEPDPVQYDIDWWIDFCKRTHTDVVTLSVGGIVAYYPTQIPLHYRSPWLGDRDLVGEFITRCRQEGIYVIARIDPHAFRDDMAKAHPEWVFVNQDGTPRRHWDNKELWVACTHGGYTHEYLTGVIREIMTLYMPDAIFSNRYTGSGICYCETCRRMFREETGFELPAPEQTDVHDPVRAAYETWNERMLFDRWAYWDAEVKKINPNAIFSPNVGGDVMRMMNLREVGRRAERINIDRQGRAARLDPMWSIGRDGRKFSAIFGQKPVAGGYSVGPEWRYRWKDAVQSIAELRQFYAVGLASGMHPSWGKFCGKLYDRRWVEPIVDMFQWHHQNQRYFRNTASLAQVGLLYHQHRSWQMDGQREKAFEDEHALGMYHALVEARIPFDLVHTDLLDERTLAKYRLIILPNTGYLTDAQCALIRDYVRAGGSVVATYESTLYQTDGAKRPDFALADVFGASYRGTLPGPIINSYVSIDALPDGRFHPLTAGLEDAGRVINGVYQLDVAPLRGQPNPPLTLIPSYPSLPMEDCYPRQEHTDIPWVYLSEAGDSRVVYFPWDIDRTFWETLCEDHFKLLRNAVRWALRDDLPVRVRGKGMVEVAAWAQESSWTVHVVNLTNPMMWKGPCRELLPLDGQEALIRLPGDRKLSGVRLLVSGEAAAYTREGDLLRLRLPPILDHEVIAMDFEGEA